MNLLPTLLTITHLIGLSFAVGAATVKVALFVGSGLDGARLAAYFAVARPITRFIIAGMALLALSGIGWLLVAHDLTPLLIVKIVLFAAVFALGPVIDNVAEPKVRRLAPAAGEPASAGFLSARRFYMALEFTATGLFYAIVVMWVLRS